jgi:hypothetical protein
MALTAGMNAGRFECSNGCLTRGRSVYFNGISTFMLSYVKDIRPSASNYPAQGLSIGLPRSNFQFGPTKELAMSLGLILVIILVIFLLGGFSGRFGGYGYGLGHGGIGIIGVILIILVVLLLLGRI